MARRSKKKQGPMEITRQTPNKPDVWLEWATLVRAKLQEQLESFDYVYGEIKRSYDSLQESEGVGDPLVDNPVDLEKIKELQHTGNYDYERLASAVGRVHRSAHSIANRILADHALKYHPVELSVGNLVRLRSGAELIGAWQKLTNRNSTDHKMILLYNEGVGEALKKHTLRGRGLKCIPSIANANQEWRKLAQAEVNRQYTAQNGGRAPRSWHLTSHLVDAMEKQPHNVPGVTSDLLERMRWHKAWRDAPQLYANWKCENGLPDDLTEGSFLILEIWKNMVVIQGKRKWCVHKDLLELVQGVKQNEGQTAS